MNFMMTNFIRFGINILDKENITQDQVEYVYNKWGVHVAERIVEMLEDETKRARKVLEELKQKREQ